MSLESIITENLDIWTSAIKTKSASGRGSSKKLELYGIKKLRELILELAVRGKLVPQKTDEEDAYALINSIEQTKKELFALGKNKKAKQLPEVMVTEEPYDLPSSWVWSRLGNLTEINPRNLIEEENVDASFVPMPLISTKFDGRHGTEIKAWVDVKKGYTHFADGDIGLAKITPCFENSKAVVFSGLVNGIGAGTTELHIARPYTEGLNPHFVLLFIKSPTFLSEGESRMTGSAGQKRVPKDFFSSYPFPLPPAREQERIVSKVSDLMILCDQLESQTESSIEAHQILVKSLLETLTNAKDADELNESWQRISAHFDVLFTSEDSIDQLKQTILQLAVMGKLVKQDPNEEPASKLLERIAAEKEQLIIDKKIKKQKRLPPISDKEKPFGLPEGWEWMSLSEIGVFTGGKTPSKSNGAYWNGSIPWVTPKDMKVERVYDSEDHVTQFALNDGLLKVEAESILLVARSGILRRRFPVAITKTVCTVNQDLKVLNLIDKSLSDYVLLMMKGFERFIIHNLTKIGTTVESLKFDEFSVCPFMLPPLNEQKRIIARVEELIALCDILMDRLKVIRETQLKISDALLSSAD